MSLDPPVTGRPKPSVSPSAGVTRRNSLSATSATPYDSAADALTDQQWKSLRKRIVAHGSKEEISRVFGRSVKGGAIYRWGFGVLANESRSTSEEGDAAGDIELQTLSRLAVGQPPRKEDRGWDLTEAALIATESFTQTRALSTRDAAVAVTWGAALPALSKKLPSAVWWDLLGSLQELRDSVTLQGVSETPCQLLIAAELGLTLAWRLADLPSCKRLQRPSADALAAWCKYDDEAIAASLQGGLDARMVLASVVRCKLILEATSKRKFKKRQLELGETLATWVAAMTTHSGGTAWCTAGRRDVTDDLPPHGLLGRATEFDSESLTPAVTAALGKSQSGGRLAWEVSLPKAFHHNADAKIAVLLPEWDVRRGRMHIDYSREQADLELFAGRCPVIAGACETSISSAGEEQAPCGDWESTCEFTDDDVHYLEIEQPWTGGLTLQRQYLLIREDRCVMMADSVLSDSGSAGPRDNGASASGTLELEYQCRYPVPEGIEFEADEETREIVVTDGKRSGLIVPLAANEWRVGPTAANLKLTDDRHLVLSVRGAGALNAPLWFDFQQRRFKRRRTWRQLTVADELRVVEAGEAVGYRIQSGSEQWLIYRSLGQSRCRTVLGKHLIADFFAARFDTGDGSLDELVTVDQNETDD